MKINREERTVIFESLEAIFEKERDGLKSNTVRMLDFEEDLTLQAERFFKEPGRIMIINSGYKPQRFTRTLSDVTRLGWLLGKCLVVFSWRGNEVEK